MLLHVAVCNCLHDALLVKSLVKLRPARPQKFPIFRPARSMGSEDASVTGVSPGLPLTKSVALQTRLSLVRGVDGFQLDRSLGRSMYGVSRSSTIRKWSTWAGQSVSQIS